MLADVAKAGAKVGEFANYVEFVLVVGQMERSGGLVGKSRGLQELHPDFAAGHCHLVRGAGGLANGRNEAESAHESCVNTLNGYEFRTWRKPGRTFFLQLGIFVMAPLCYASAHWGSAFFS